MTRLLMILALLALAGCSDDTYGASTSYEAQPHKPVTICTTAFHMLVCEED